MTSIAVTLASFSPASGADIPLRGACSLCLFLAGVVFIGIALYLLCKGGGKEWEKKS